MRITIEVKHKYINAAICMFALVISFIAEYQFSVGNWLSGWQTYAFDFAVVAVQAITISGIFRAFVPALHEKHSRLIFILAAVISALVLCVLLMFNLLRSMDNNIEAIKGAVVFNMIPLMAASVCILIYMAVFMARHRINKPH